MDRFCVWWVEQHGRPPLPGEGDAFRLAFLAWITRRRAAALGPDAVVTVREAWAASDSVDQAVPFNEADFFSALGSFFSAAADEALIRDLFQRYVASPSETSDGA